MGCEVARLKSWPKKNHQFQPLFVLRQFFRRRVFKQVLVLPFEQKLPAATPPVDSLLNVGDECLPEFLEQAFLPENQGQRHNGAEYEAASAVETRETDRNRGEPDGTPPFAGRYKES